MEEFFRFIQQSGRERSHLIHDACAICDSVVPSTPVSEHNNKQPTDRAISVINAGVVS
jgi:hypothetical protein